MPLPRTKCLVPDPGGKQEVTIYKRSSGHFNMCCYDVVCVYWTKPDPCCVHYAIGCLVGHLWHFLYPCFISCFLSFLQSVWLTAHAFLAACFRAYWVCSSSPAEQSASKHTLNPTALYVPLVFSIAPAAAILLLMWIKKSELTKVKLVQRKSCQLVLYMCVCVGGWVGVDVCLKLFSTIWENWIHLAVWVETNWTTGER